MQHELLPKVCVAIALLVGAAGIVSYFGSSVASESSALAAKTKLRREVVDNRIPPPADRPANQPVVEQQTSSSNTDASTKLQREAKRESSTEPVYYCGAMTKKGTPCTRRLKTKGRCWQHAGQPNVENELKQSVLR